MFYWLSKCSQGTAGSESEELEDLLLQFTREVRKEALRLVEIMKTLLMVNAFRRDQADFKLQNILHS